MAFPPLILFLVLPCPTVLRVPIFWGAGTQPCFFVSLSSSHFFYFRLVQWQGQLSLLNADDLHRTSRHQACWRFWRVFDSVRLSWRFSKVVAELCHALLCGDNYWKSFGCGEGECLADVCPTQWLQHFCGPKRPQFQMASKDHKGQMNGFKRICTLAPSNGSNEQQYANVTDATEEGSGRKILMPREYLLNLALFSSDLILWVATPTFAGTTGFEVLRFVPLYRAGG